MALSLISVNVEWDKRLETVLPFLKERTADVVCVQELLEKDIPLFEQACGPCVGYAPVGCLQGEDGLYTEGEGLFTRLPVANVQIRYYVGSREGVRLNDGKSDNGTHAFITAEVGDERYRIATTHLTWTMDGESTEAQIHDLNLLFAALDDFGELVLVGDFNAPRGRETFTRLAARYKDNIPPHYETSLDLSVHKARNIPEVKDRLATYMVDGLFTTSGYSAKDVSLQFGVSDHAAIVATIEKTA
jgi:endonuclease/exonuclease/phosphatase family metal-dependent hydrolase